MRGSDRVPASAMLLNQFPPDYREGSMPDSPVDVKNPPHGVPSLSPGMPPVASRPLSSASSMSGANGAHSPHSSYSGRTPSPPSLAGAAQGQQQLPPACGARQLSKLKRFLTTLQQFGSDISPEIGERVRSLVLGLVNSHLSIEEFHAKLQEATNFPLRPFVIPFLKANLPLLQRELLHCARMAKQTPQQYLAHNERMLFDPTHSPIDTQELTTDINENGKRRSPDRPKENGLDPHSDPLHPAKRPHTISPVGPARLSPGSGSCGPPFGYHMGPIRLEDISLNRELRERERLDRERIDRERLDRERLERERDRHFSGYGYHRPDHFEHLERLEDDWKHVENMMHCIVSMVDKCKRALTALQDRSQRDREELAIWMRRHSELMEGDVKKRVVPGIPGEGLGRSLDDRVADVKRRAVCEFPEEAVNEVKRQAVAELQKAVAAAEAKANELVTSERVKMERTLAEARKQAQEEILSSLNQQEESSEVGRKQSCWNCGRKASETCSGCNVARYCGSFCQHKDWETHHRVCGQALSARGGGPGGQPGPKAAATATVGEGGKADLPMGGPQPLISQIVSSGMSVGGSGSGGGGGGGGAGAGAVRLSPLSGAPGLVELGAVPAGAALGSLPTPALAAAVTPRSPGAMSTQSMHSPTNSAASGSSRSGSRASTPADGKPDNASR